MLNRRIVIVAGALVGALLAAVATWSYLQGADKRAYAGTAVVKVFRVTKPVPKGTPGETALDNGFITSADMPVRFRPPTATAAIDSIRGKVAQSDLAVGQVVVDGQFLDAKLVGDSFAGRIPEGQVAITVQVDQVRGVAELIQPGDKVNLFTQSPDGERVLLQNVDVIAVGTTAPVPGAPPAGGEAAAAPIARGLITFAVPPESAARIAYATTGPVTRDAGVYLTLVNPKNKPVPIPIVNPGNLYAGPLTPYGP